MQNTRLSAAFAKIKGQTGDYEVIKNRTMIYKFYFNILNFYDDAMFAYPVALIKAKGNYSVNSK
jgi:hypothetical protein